MTDTKLTTELEAVRLELEKAQADLSVAADECDVLVGKERARAEAAERDAFQSETAIDAYRTQRDRYKSAYDERHDEWVIVSRELAAANVRTEESERRLKAEESAHGHTMAELAAANDRVARLEEAVSAAREMATLLGGYDYSAGDRAGKLLTAFQAAALSAAPQASTEQNCGNCWTCTADRSRMILCPTCGNKRCPKANDHTLVCSGSNEPGHLGSAYADAPFPPPIATSPIPQVAQASGEAWSVVNEALPGELPSSRYSAETIAYAIACDLMRVTSDGLGFIRGVKPDYPDPTPAEPQGRPELAGDRVDQLRTAIDDALRSFSSPGDTTVSEEMQSAFRYLADRIVRRLF